MGENKIKWQAEAHRTEARRKKGFLLSLTTWPSVSSHGKIFTSLKSLTLEGKVKREKKSFWRVLDHYLGLDPFFLKRKLGLELEILNLPLINALRLRNVFDLLKNKKAGLQKVTSPDNCYFSCLTSQWTPVLAHFTKQTILFTGLLVILFFTFFQQKPLRSEYPLRGCLFPDPVPSLPPPAPSGLHEPSPWITSCGQTARLGLGFSFLFFFGEDSHRQLGLNEWNQAMVMITGYLILSKQIKVSKDL